MKLKPILRRRAIRHIVASILAGGFEQSEIDSIVLLLLEPSFQEELSEALLRTADQLPLFADYSEKNEKSKKYSKSVRDAVSMIRALKISTRELRSIIAQIAPEDLPDLEQDTYRSVSEFVNRFYNLTSPLRFDALLLKLRSRVVQAGQDDPYLELINKRLP